MTRIVSQNPTAAEYFSAAVFTHTRGQKKRHFPMNCRGCPEEIMEII